MHIHVKDQFKVAFWRRLASNRLNGPLPISKRISRTVTLPPMVSVLRLSSLTTHGWSVPGRFLTIQKSIGKGRLCPFIASSTLGSPNPSWTPKRVLVLSLLNYAFKFVARILGGWCRWSRLKISALWAAEAAVPKLAVWLLPTWEVCSSNPVTGNF